MPENIGEQFLNEKYPDLIESEPVKTLNKNSGFIFLEIIISIALISIVFITLLGVGFLSLNVSQSLQKSSESDSLIAEEIEAVRAFRDSTASAWSTTGIGSLNTASDYHFVLSGSPPSWSVVTGSEVLGDFTRKVVFDSVQRDANGYIVLSGGTDDPDTRKVTVQVISSSKNYQTITYLTNWQK
ncbi:MAG: hypothetical protein AAB340_03655 [Patescibacteria group bacterium]